MINIVVVNVDITLCTTTFPPHLLIISLEDLSVGSLLWLKVIRTAAHDNSI